MQWRVETNKGERFAILHDDGVLLYERVKATTGPDGVGQLLAIASAELVQQFIEFANETSAAIAIDLIPRRIGLHRSGSDYQALTAAKFDGSQATWIALSEKRKFVITTTLNGATLVGEDGQNVLTVSKDEIAAHEARALRGRDSMRVDV